MTTPAASTAKSAGVWEDFVDIFYAPSDVFERRREGRFRLGLVILTVLSVAIFFATKGGMQAVMDAEFQRKAAEQMAKNPQLTPETLEKGRAIGEKLGWLIVLVVTPLLVFLTGLLLWIGGKLVDAKESLSAAVMVATYAMVPRLIASLVAGVQGLLMSPDAISSRYSVSLSVARFLDPTATNPLLFKLAGQVDVFAIWSAVLLAIGLSVTGRISRRNAAAIAAVIWLLGTLFG